MVMGKTQKDAIKSSYFAEKPHTICMSTSANHCRKITCQSDAASVSQIDQKGEKNAVFTMKNNTDMGETLTGMQANRKVTRVKG